MKQFLMVAALLAGTFALGHAQKGGKSAAAKTEEPKQMKTQQDSLGYAIGMDVGQNLKQQNIQLNVEFLYEGLKAAMAENGSPALTQEQSRAVIQAWQKAAQEQQMRERQEKAAAAVAKGKAFLAENGKRPGVITLDNGLQYEVVQEGTGPSPSPSSRVTTHYRGTLIDGTTFDASYDRGQPATFAVNGVIQAWQIILPMMKEGGKVKIYSPSELAYGERGSGPKIGPNEVLIFEIELLKVL
jgi:FKBP-type peptidyl-prolyl cis-trans isomerase FklB